MPIDYKKYPKNWKEIRAKILDRAGNACECTGECGHSHKIPGLTERCYAENGNYINRDPGNKADWSDGAIKDPKSIRVVLTVAHLDQDLGDNLLRLKALCQFCHLNYDKHQHAETRKRNQCQK